MEEKKENLIEDKKELGALIICLVLFAIFFVNVILGKLNISYGMKLPHLGNVAEFLLLFISSISLIFAALKSEKKRNNLERK